MSKSSSPPPTPEHYALLANAIRALALDAVEDAGCGHPGLPLGAADFTTLLFGEFIKLDPIHPDWPDRDRFILSAGHGSMLLYALHYLLGYEDMTLDEIRNFRQLGAKTAGHPEYGVAAGIETTTGPLGQGLGNAVGMALAERMLNARFGDELVSHRTYVLASDGDLMEGISHEAIALAGHLQLGRLIVLFDDNGISIDGPVSLADSGDMVKRFEAAGWHAQSLDGHDVNAVRAALAAAQTTPQPSLLACKTVIGKYAPEAGQSATHGAAMGAEKAAATRAAMGWRAPPFDIPPDILDGWRVMGRRSVKDWRSWCERLAACDEATRDAFAQAQRTSLPDNFAALIKDAKSASVRNGGRKALATRVASQQVLEHLVPAIPALIGGSADLTSSNNTKTAAQTAISAKDFSGRFIHYGVREHAMAAAMNGMALHGGVIPYSGTFLVFSDYMRPAMRLAAMMGQRVIYVLTHDSIGLGEDGPTHQPIEHLSALRAIPGLRVLRPADAVETAECWQLALQYEDGPSVLALTRQAVPPVREDADTANRAAAGAYLLAGEELNADIHLIASGSEVHLAADARDVLESEGLKVRLISCPCLELLAEQSAGDRAALLGQKGVRVIVEAGLRQSWDRYLRPQDCFLGLSGFGASGPGDDVFRHFQLTAAAVAETARNRVKGLQDKAKKS